MAENWENHKRILVILAHPDDPEFFCGASVCRWVQAGHEVIYRLLTCGDKGTPDRKLSSKELCTIRQREQISAAEILGVSDVTFLDYPDGYLVPDLKLRRDVTRIIRQLRPDILVTCDPKTLYISDNRLNHPDHRAAGQAVLDAVYPAARDHLYFPELIRVENLNPHKISEVWISGTLSPNVELDVTEYWDRKIEALFEHKSQIGNPEEFADRMKKRHTPESTIENPSYVESFRRIYLD